MTESFQLPGRTSGRRVVLTVYATVVAVAGLMGFILGVISPKELDPELFGLIQLPPTPLGMAIFGIVTIGVGLGVLLLAVRAVASRVDTHRPS